MEEQTHSKMPRRSVELLALAILVALVAAVAAWLTSTGSANAAGNVANQGSAQYAPVQQGYPGTGAAPDNGQARPGGRGDCPKHDGQGSGSGSSSGSSGSSGSDSGTSAGAPAAPTQEL